MVSRVTCACNGKQDDPRTISHSLLEFPVKGLALACDIKFAVMLNRLSTRSGRAGCRILMRGVWSQIAGTHQVTGCAASAGRLCLVAFDSTHPGLSLENTIRFLFFFFKVAVGHGAQGLPAGPAASPGTWRPSSLSCCACRHDEAQRRFWAARTSGIMTGLWAFDDKSECHVDDASTTMSACMWRKRVAESKW